MTPEYLELLAHRADPDELWRLSWEQQRDMTDEQRKAMHTAVALRRYASDRRELDRALAEKKSVLITPLAPHCNARRFVDTPPDHERMRPRRNLPRREPT